MEIKYLNHLKSNPVKPGSMKYWVIEPLSITEIQNLEQIYNNSQEFPKALRELLWLAGKYCYVLDYGIYENLHLMQQSVRDCMLEQNRVITKPSTFGWCYHQPTT